MSTLRDEQDEVIRSFHEKRLEDMEEAFEEHMEQMLNEQREIADKSIERAVQQVYNNKRSDPMQEYSSYNMELDRYTEAMLDQEEDENDPVHLAADVHDQTLVDMREELLEAVNSNKEEVLKIAIKIFNKVQDQNLKTVRLQTVDTSEGKVDPQQVQENLQKYNLLLNDARSPIYSAIQTVQSGNLEGPDGNFEMLYQDLDDFIENRISLEDL